MSEKTLPRLPRANAEFELLRENGGLYVDKTDLIHALIELDEPVFCPARGVLVRLLS